MEEEKFVPDIEEYEIEEEEEANSFECLDEDIYPEGYEDETDLIQTELEEEKEKLDLDEEAIAEINRYKEPSYTHIKFPYYLICEKRLAEKMREVRMLLKSEVEKITAEQTSAFESVRIRRLYKTGMGLPERIFVEHDKGYTFRERERLKYLLHHEIV